MNNLDTEERTLGDKFWKKEFREALQAPLKEAFDQTVLREELDGDRPPNPNLASAPIRLKEDWDGRAPFRRSVKLAPEEMEVCRQQLNELLAKGLISPSASPFGAPVLIVPKPHQPGKWRMVIDYRALNEITVNDKFPLPDIPGIMNSLEGKKIFSCLDLLSGFYHVPVYKPHVERTAMSTPFGNYEWNFMPMGLKNSPSVFQRNMNEAFKGMEDFVKVFVDDVIISSMSVEQHRKHLMLVFERMKKMGLMVKGSKVQLFSTRVQFLGHVISADGVAPQEEKVKSVQEWPIPKNLSDLKGFLGLVGYYRKFIFNFADKAKPLNDLTKKEAEFPKDEKGWSKEQLDALTHLKLALMTAPVLALPDYKGASSGKHPFLVQTDASGGAMGGILMQDQGKGLQPIAFASKTFSPAECNYNTTERELRALVWATCEEFRHYILGTAYKLQGDHRPLTTLMTPGRALSRRQARWVEVLQENGVPSMEYIPGVCLPVPDALSRRSDLLANMPSPTSGLTNGLPEAESGGKTEPLEVEGLEPQSLPRDTILPPQLSKAPKAVTLPEEMMCEKTLKEQQDALEAKVMFGIAELGLSSCAEIRYPAGTQETWKEHTGVTSAASENDFFYFANGLAWLDMDGQLENDRLCIISDLAKGIAKGQTTAMSMAAGRRMVRHRFADNQNWTINRNEYIRWDQRIGRFTVDACTDANGLNAQNPIFWTDCLQIRWDGQTVWCNPPFSDPDTKIADILMHFQTCRRRTPSTSACFILPYFATAAWNLQLSSMEEMELLHTYEAGSDLFIPAQGIRVVTQWPVQVWWGKPLPEATDETTECFGTQAECLVGETRKGKVTRREFDARALQVSRKKLILELQTATAADPLLMRMKETAETAT